jgi:hypothetical protein
MQRKLSKSPHYITFIGIGMFTTLILYLFISTVASWLAKISSELSRLSPQTTEQPAQPIVIQFPHGGRCFFFLQVWWYLLCSSTSLLGQLPISSEGTIRNTITQKNGQTT